MSRPVRPTNPLVFAGILLGCGLGALFDGILLHQILQWHNMLSSVRPPTDLAAMKYNMLYDGLFHAFAWVVTVAGLLLLWSTARRPQVRLSTRAFHGSLLLGWGLFNVLEGTLDHHIFGLHHVHPGELQQAWDVGFLVWGAVMVLAGLTLVRRVHVAR
jgi:uncharacterized membrane protein